MSTSSKQLIEGETKVANKYGDKVFQPDWEQKRVKMAPRTWLLLPSKTEKLTRFILAPGTTGKWANFYRKWWFARH